MTAQTIALRDVNISFGGKSVLDGFSLGIPLTGVTCFTGASGCGKTTLLRVIAGLLRPDSGTVTGVPGRIGFMFQDDRLLPWFPVSRNIEAVLPDAGKSDAVSRVLNAVELSDEADTMPRELSGGMRRRAALARALAYPCELLMLDEPFKGLDADLSARMAALILEQHVPVIAVTHSEDEIALLGGETVRFGGPPLTIPS